MSSNNRKIPKIFVKKILWEKIRNKASEINRYKWDFPTLSCNEDAEVWFDQIKGWNRPPREDVSKEEFPFINDIVKYMLKSKPRGGRFHLGSDEVFLTGYFNCEPVCKIIV